MLGLLRRHAGNALQAHADLFFSFLQVTLLAVELTLQRRNLMLARVEGLHAAVEGLLTLVQAIFSRTDFAHAFFVLFFSLLLHTKDLILRFDNGFLAQGFSLLFCVGYQRLSLLRRTLAGSVRDIARDYVAESDAHDGTDDKPDNTVHALSFLFHGFMVTYKVYGIKNAGHTPGMSIRRPNGPHAYGVLSMQNADTARKLKHVLS